MATRRRPRRESRHHTNAKAGGDANTRHGYPRPQLVREDFHALDGRWDFTLDPDASLRRPRDVNFDRAILVPFAPECPASGVEETGFFKGCWYRRTFVAPSLEPRQRLILHFGAIDYEATVWVNGHLAAHHEGGYTPFHADITDLLIDGSEQTIIVRAEDDPHDLGKPRGKQDWKPQPHAIWYYRTSGIWQSVWMERVNETRIERVRWTANVQQWQIELSARIAGPDANGCRLRVRLHARGQKLVEDVYDVTGDEVQRAIRLPDPGIDDARAQMLWTPWSPNLIHADLELLDDRGNVIDAAASYTAMRSISILGGRVLLNGRPITLQLVLDQGYWPEGGLTAPDDEAYRRDVELVKALGFNGVRKHQKIESPRFLYWADVLGLLVWEEMPSVYRFSDHSMRRLAAQWTEAIERDASHPCIIAWVPFNESWGVPDLPRVEAQRHAVSGIYHLTKMLDPTRPVIGNDGWEAVATDIVGIHDYDGDPSNLLKRYEAGDLGTVQRILTSERPGHRALVLDDFSFAGQPVMLSEFGGIAYSKDYNGTWGYSRARTAKDLAERYAHLLEVVRGLSMLSGFCYTQFTDTYQEANGLVYMDRKPKFALEQIACATRGPRSPRDREIYERWRERLMALRDR
jgi:beta-galactosidase/beta-glucuronidase